jgi:hypothetical protein
LFASLNEHKWLRLGGIAKKLNDLSDNGIYILRGKKKVVLTQIRVVPPCEKEKEKTKNWITYRFVEITIYLGL